MMKEIAIITIGITISVTFICALIFGTSRTEAGECLRWQIDAKKYPSYYITEWQKQQCDSYSITIDAPVR